MTFRFPLATDSWGPEERAALLRVIDSGWHTMGPCVQRFEAEYAALVGSRHCVMANSGSSANLLMVAALCYTSDPARRLRRGDEVIVPAVSWSTTYFPLHQYGLRIKFVDIDLQTLNFDLAALRAAVSDRTRAILAVNLLGNPNDFRQIRDIIGERDIVLLEDNCEAMGARFDGRHAGTFGLMGTTSTFFSHHISTMEGGLIVTDDDELSQVLRVLRAHGWTRQLPDVNLVCGSKGSDPFDESFRFVLPGYNLRPLEMSAAVGSEQLRRLPALIAHRRENARLVQDALAGHPHLMLQQEIGESSWFGFSLVIRPGSPWTRADLRRRLDELGFEYRPVVAGNFARSEVTRLLDCETHGALANADYLHDHGLFIGNQGHAMAQAVEALRSL
jgi:CDP-6-deoxy-D-xylo-4-hexulose-3-dehydrase